MTMTLEQIEQNATAGPWKIVRSPEEAYDSTADVVRIEIYQLSDESETSPIADVSQEYVSRHEAEANAALMCAGRETSIALKALRNIVKHFELTRLPVSSGLADSIQIFGREAITRIEKALGLDEK